MAITPLPSLDRTSATFKTDVDTFFATQLPTFSTQVNSVATDASTSASTATTQAGIATTQAGIATTKAGEALTSANIAAVSAISALNAPGTSATSATSLAIGTGSKSFTIQVGKAYSIGQFLVIAYTITPANYMIGQITAFDSGTGAVTVNVASVGGSGTYATWSVALTATDSQTLIAKTLTTPRYTRDDDGTISGGTWAIDYANGPLIKATVGAAITSITLSNLPASGTVGHLKLMIVNPGAYTITFPAAWKFTKTDFTLTNFAGLGVTLPANGVVFMDLLSDDNGTNVYVTISRN